MSGGGGSSAQPTQQTVTQSTIPQWFQPTADSIIGAGMGNTFNMTQNPDGTMTPTSMVGFTPFGTATGQTDANGNPILSGYSPSAQLAANAAVAGFTPLQQQAQAGIAGLQMPSQFGSATDLTNQAAQGALGSAQAAYGYGNQGQASGLQGQQLGVQGGLGYGSQAAGLAGQNIGVGQQGMQAGMSYGQNATNPNAVQSYMNPYLASTLTPAMQLLNQQYGMQGAAEQGAATSQGAFGGSREALMQGLNQQNANLASNQLVSNAYNQAYNTANQNMQAASQLGMQGANVGLAGLQNANAAYNTGLQGVNTALQGTAQGMQGAQVGLQGVNAAQAGYGLAGQQATNLANIGNQQLQAQEGIYGLQNQTGAQQQQQYQNVLNQAIQNYSNQQQYPMTQLANLMNLGRATPTQTSTVSYQAPPSAISQIAGLGTAGIAGLGLYNTMNKGANQ